MEKRNYPQLGEEFFVHTLENGLQIAVLPRPGFQRKVAYFATNFGSIDTRFALDGEKLRVPDGIAHFLEHKMFDMPDGRDVSAEFAAMGAYPNAFTSFFMTAYYFNCTEHFEACLKLLLEFVSTPYFTRESVDKELGIIGQEIGIYRDSPDSRVFQNLMELSYDNHPIRVPILGTEETIAKITPEVLYKCHKAFYNPGNMLLCVMGDVDPETVCAIAEKQLGDIPVPMVERSRVWQEDIKRTQKEKREKMEVAMPMFQLGFKCEPAADGWEMARQEIIGDLAAEALFGESSALYLRMYGEGLIDSSFGGGIDCMDGMAQLVCGGDSDHPEKVRDAILQEAKVLSETGITEEDFLRMKRSAMGRRIRGLDRFDSTCFRICAYHFTGVDYFRFPELYDDITREEIREFIGKVVTEDRMCLSVIEPETEEENL